MAVPSAAAATVGHSLVVWVGAPSTGRHRPPPALASTTTPPWTARVITTRSRAAATQPAVRMGSGAGTKTSDCAGPASSRGNKATRTGRASPRAPRTSPPTRSQVLLARAHDDHRPLALQGRGHRALLDP